MYKVWYNEPALRKPENSILNSTQNELCFTPMWSIIHAVPFRIDCQYHISSKYVQQLPEMQRMFRCEFLCARVCVHLAHSVQVGLNCGSWAVELQRIKMSLWIVSQQHSWSIGANNPLLICSQGSSQKYLLYVCLGWNGFAYCNNRNYLVTEDRSSKEVPVC
jgi:hypothetical protein